MLLPRLFAGLCVALLGAAPGALSPGARAAEEGAGEATPGAARSALAQRLDAALDVPALRGAARAALVVHRASGEVLYARDADRALVPASNLKLLTAVAALAYFGPAHRFTTRVLAPAAPDEEGAVDWLAVQGGGDPALTSEQWWRLAADLRAQGVRRVRGELRVDGSVFDDERWHPTWAPVTARAYHAPVGGLSANYGAFRVVIEPGGAPGSPVVVRLDPPLDYFDLRVEAETAPPGTPRSLEVERTPRPEGDRVTVRGRLAAGAEPAEIWRSVSHPDRYAGAVFRMQLEANGIAVEGGVRRAATPADAHELRAFEGFPLARIARLFLKNSNNMIAEALVKAMGIPPEGVPAAPAAPGGWSAGLAAARGVLEGLGIDTEGLVLADGSGLSRDNRVTPRQLVATLRAADASFAFGPELVAGLPLAGTDGTLERRAEEASGAVRAKTGLLSGVTGLSGFARTGRGEVAFAVLVNGYRASDTEAMGALDGFAAALATDAGSGPR